VIVPHPLALIFLLAGAVWAIEYGLVGGIVASVAVPLQFLSMLADAQADKPPTAAPTDTVERFETEGSV
jgi:hypothetical protein